MKKTQSLKLMLLGLMALVSGSAWAAVGDIFSAGSDAGGYLYYQQVTAKGAKLIGVKTVGTGGNIVIPSKAKNDWETKNNNLDVIAVDNDWFGKTEVIVVHYGANGQIVSNSQASQPSEDLRNYNGKITLTIEAKELKTISTQALQPLNGKIKKFVVYGGDPTATPDAIPSAGLTAIPDYAFFNGTLDEEATEANVDQAVQGQIDALESQKDIKDFLLNGADTESEENPALYPDGRNLYYLLDPTKSNASTQEKVKDANGNYIYVVMGTKADDQGFYDLINAKTGAVVEKGKKYGDKLLTNVGQKAIALLVTEPVKGLADQLADAQSLSSGYAQTLAADEVPNSDYQQAKKAYDKALAELEVVLYVKKKIQDPNNTTLNTLLSNSDENVIAAMATAIEDQTIPNTIPADQIDNYTQLRNILLNDPKWPKTTDGKGYIIYAIGGIATAEATARTNLALVDAVDDEGDADDEAAETLQDHDKAVTEKAAADAKIAALEPMVQELEDQIDNLNAQIDELKNNLYIPVYKAALDPITAEPIPNDVLEVVNLNGTNLVAIGTSAFQNCTKAIFGPSKGGIESRLPLTTKTIGARAFQNTKINPVFDNLRDLESIGDFAFAQSGATTAVFTDAINLKSFGTNVFDDCALENLLLEGTPLKAMPGNLAQGLKRVYKKFVSACGDFYNYDVNNADDKAALTAKGFTDADLAPVAQGGKNGGQQLVNVSLKTASLPVAITEIPNETFAYCINLATLTDGIPAGVTKIGDLAFFATKISEFDLQALTKLATIGSGAFGGNKELTKVLLAKTAPLTTLPEDAFECDSKLGTVTLPDDTKCLPAGLFADSNIQSLDLSKTQITVLPDLFFATEDNPNETLKFIKLPETAYDENGVQTRPGLQIILDGALAHLTKLVGWEYETGKYRMEIPSSVWCMRPGVFEGDNSLTEVYAMDSQLRNLGAKTFNGCTSLKKFTFVTANIIDPKWNQYGTTIPQSILGPCYDADLVLPYNANFSFDDMLFFRCNEKSSKNDNVEVVVTEESMFALYGNDVETYPMEYSTISIYPTTITLGDFGGSAYSSEYFSQDYGTWIKTTDATVYTAYQDLGKVYMYRAKHNNGYYKIPASVENVEFSYNADGKLGFWYSGESRPVWTESVYVVGSNGQPILDNNLNKQILSGLPVNYIYANDDVRKPWESAAVIIVSTKEVIPYERHTKPAEKYQSTLDRDNELRITGKPIDLTDLNPVYAWYFSGDTDDANFVKVNSGTAPAGVVVMKLSDYQGTAAPSRLEVVWVDDEVTSIMGVKEYVKSLNSSDVIYNLQGVRVKNTVKGQMYIQNGKKFIQK